MNTFHLESPRPFKAFLVERAARELLDDALRQAEEASTTSEPPAASGTLALSLATQLREKVIQLDFLRYLIVLLKKYK